MALEESLAYACRPQEKSKWLASEELEHTNIFSFFRFLPSFLYKLSFVPITCHSPLSSRNSVLFVIFWEKRLVNHKCPEARPLGSKLSWGLYTWPLSLFVTLQMSPSLRKNGGGESLLCTLQIHRGPNKIKNTPTSLQRILLVLDHDNPSYAINNINLSLINLNDQAYTAW